MKNKVQLITYVDRLSSGGFKALNQLLNGKLKDLFGGVHVLPFFENIDDEDAGFDPKNHLAVDTRLGDWDDVKKLASNFEVMADIIVNHMSADSPQFQDFIEHGNDSQYSDLFLKFSDVFKNGATEEELLNLYRPRPGMPFTRYNLKNGSSSLLWTTFTSRQVDIDVRGDQGKAYLQSILERFNEAGVKSIRLDAAGYAIKTPGTSCFMTDDTFSYIEKFRESAHALGMEVLVEIHSHYKTQIEIAKRVDMVYDFALPPLTLHALLAKTSTNLKTWLQQSPRNCITVLDTHDGIGIVDVAPHGADKPGILDKDEVDFLVSEIHRKSNNTSKKATGVAANNLDLYQVNCTYYEALGSDDQDYLLARLIQFCCPGIPQVYYTGLLAGLNDMELLQSSSVGRDINRHYYSDAEIEETIHRPVVNKLFTLIKFRNAHPAFDGEFDLRESSATELSLSWTLNEHSLDVIIDLDAKCFVIKSIIDKTETTYTEWDALKV